MASPAQNPRREPVRSTKSESRIRVAPRDTQTQREIVELGRQFYEQLRAYAEHTRASKQ